MFRSEPAPPVRIVHLGLGAFFRAHEAWYTERANALSGDEPWGIHAFTGRSPAMAHALSAQDCVYTLIERGADEDSASIIEAISRASDGADAATWRDAVADPATAIVSLTITEAGYLVDVAGRPVLYGDAISADLALLCAGTAGGAPSTAPARLVDGLRARFAASGAPIAIMSCDNLPHNGNITREVVLAVAERVDAGLAEWIRGSVSFVSTMVDRITPATTDADRSAAAALTGIDDATPVVTEPFTEWVICGDFPAGRPRWELAGARFVDRIDPYERRKLWLLNAGHSLLAYVGLAHGAETIDEAMANEAERDLLERLWHEAAVLLPFRPEEIEESLAALRSRFTNPRIRHRLVQIAADGSQKLPPRILDVYRARHAAGLRVGEAGATVIAAWAMHITGNAALISDPAAGALIRDLVGVDDLTPRVLGFLAPDLLADLELADAMRTAISTISPVPERELLS